jgi:hypothetical protein
LPLSAATIVAFANTDGGQFVLGVANDRSVRGVDDSERVTRDVDNVAVNNCQPPITIIQEIVLPSNRGLYLSRQEFVRQVFIVLVAVLTAVYLIGSEGITRYLHMIGLGVAAAAWSLYYLWQIPNVGVSVEPQGRDYLRRAMAPLRDSVFRHYLWFAVTLRMILSAYSPFMVVFLRESLQLSPSGVIAINTVGSLGAIATLGQWGRWTDRVGAKPALAVSICGVGLGLLLWLIARPGGLWIWLGIPAISLVQGIFTGGLTVSMSRFELGFIPIRGRAHYVAINVAVTGLCSALAALAAGGMIEAFSGLEPGSGWLVVDRFTLFFAICAGLLAAPLIIRRRLPEDRARSLRALFRRELLRRSRRVRRLLRAGIRL